jgi:hypothetical protein
VPAEAGRAAREPSARRSLHAESRCERAQLHLRVQSRARRDSLLPPSSLHTLSLRALPCGVRSFSASVATGDALQHEHSARTGEVRVYLPASRGLRT